MITKREALAWLEQRPDAAGECDQCHKENVPLWGLPHEIDADLDANWLYCAQCFRAIIARKCE